MLLFLVTGGAGFIGSNLAHELVERGEAVRVLDNFSTGRRANLEGVWSQIEVIAGDMQDADVCRRAVAGVDFVLHHGAVTAVQRSVGDPLRVHAINATATLNLLIAAPRCRGQTLDLRVLFIGLR